MTWKKPFFYDSYGRAQWLFKHKEWRAGEDFSSWEQVQLPGQKQYGSPRRPKRYIHEFATKSRCITDELQRTRRQAQQRNDDDSNIELALEQAQTKAQEEEEVVEEVVEEVFVYIENNVIVSEINV
jgi:hypothetical protein